MSREKNNIKNFIMCRVKIYRKTESVVKRWMNIYKLHPDVRIATTRRPSITYVKNVDIEFYSK